MKEKGDSCILVGYSTQSKGYRVYNKRTRLIVESIHINLDEIKELSKASDYDNSGLAPPRQNLSFERADMTFEHNSSILGIQDHNNEPSSSELVPNVSPPADINAPSLQELDFLFSSLFKEYFTAGNQTDAHIDENEIYNIFSTRTKDHLLEQVHENPSKPVQIRRQLATDPEMYMFALTVSKAEPKHIKEAMADSAWTEAMQDILHQFDRLQV
ncbi:hypothetical protein Tco_1535039 [Tanacetum coccineum]